MLCHRFRITCSGKRIYNLYLQTNCKTLHKVYHCKLDAPRSITRGQHDGVQLVIHVNVPLESLYLFLKTELKFVEYATRQKKRHNFKLCKYLLYFNKSVT